MPRITATLFANENNFFAEKIGYGILYLSHSSPISLYPVFRNSLASFAVSLNWACFARDIPQTLSKFSPRVIYVESVLLNLSVKLSLLITAKKSVKSSLLITAKNSVKPSLVITAKKSPIHLHAVFTVLKSPNMNFVLAEFAAELRNSIWVLSQEAKRTDWQNMGR
ncbi:hypothetical protein BB561_000915 [Smittium simulii]|uniref:Uncharacterized protein n=1 Tax=Smittium simulii TaxID=133385 RepID=A0A2T9YWU3_9FUNG|nr:hypothetical protein BB561_000915 [Smittium simulii]